MKQIYAYGMISSSTLHLLEHDFPKPDTYAEIKESFSMIGGEAANSSLVLSRLGINIKIDGNWLSRSSCENIINIFKNNDIDYSSLKIKNNYQGVYEILFVDKLHRTNFGNYRALLFTSKQWNDPQKEDIENADMVLLDPFFKDSSHFCAEFCTQMNKPYITVDCPHNNYISQKAHVNIISGEFRKREYPDANTSELLQIYVDAMEGCCIFTSGDGNILYGSKEKGILSLPACSIDPQDTTGGGDSFRAGMAYGLVQGWSIEKSIQFASILAAYICESFPGVLKAPNKRQLQEYIQNKEWDFLWE